MTRYPATLCLALLSLLAPAPPASAQTAPVPVPPILFPVAQGAQWEDTFGAPRSGHTHIGQDLMAPKMRPLIACFAGTVTLHSDRGTAGNWVTLQGTGDALGWRAEYMHLNNDTPGTNDNLGGERHAFAPGLKTGDTVMAGQLLGYVGDSGNAETAGSHCHFELHGPGGPVNCAILLRAARTLFAPQILQTRNATVTPPTATALVTPPAAARLSLFVGNVLTVFPDQGEAIVRVTSITPKGGRAATLDPPVVKRLVIRDKDAFSTLTKDVLLTAEGMDPGQGRALQVERLTTLGAAPPRPVGSTEAKSVPIDGFESGGYGKWKRTGNCWGVSPEEITDRLPAPGAGGRYYLSTAHPQAGDNRPASGTGVALSPEVTLTLPRLRFRIGGGSYPDECCLNLIVDGKIVRTETGSGSDRLTPVEWDITEFAGKKARLQIVDNRDNGLRAYLLLDELEMTSESSPLAAPDTKAEPANPITSVAAVIPDQTPGARAFILLPDGTRVEGRELVTMEATGYGPGNNGQWGDRTALGTRVGYGTVAVDPKVIPLRTHLWVEGYGFCTALDTGSSIKGMKIDLGHNSDTEAATVGRKKRRVLILD